MCWPCPAPSVTAPARRGQCLPWVSVSLLPLRPALESGLRALLCGTSVPSPQMSSHQPPDPDAVCSEPCLSWSLALA